MTGRTSWTLFARKRLHFSEFSALCNAQIDVCVAEGSLDAARAWLEIWDQAIDDHPELVDYDNDEYVDDCDLFMEHFDTNSDQMVVYDSALASAAGLGALAEEFADVDHLVLNEAEVTLPQFLADFEKGQAARLYTSDKFISIENTPAPKWDLVDMRKYASMNIQYSRGCPYDCEFCDISVLFGDKVRTKPSARLIGELNSLYELGWRGDVFFVDDNFIGHKRRLKTELLPALIEWKRDKRGFPFSTEISINLADDPELIQMMVEAGFSSVFIGIETPSEDSLAECSKKQNLNRDLVEDVKRIQRAGLQVQGGFIVGFDHDTPSIFQRQFEFIQRSNIVTAMVGLLQAPPGTRLYERLRKAGRLVSRMSGDNVDGTTNIIPHMDIDTLRRGYKQLLKQIYSPKVYYRRVMAFLAEYQPPKMRVPLDAHLILEHLLAFLRSIYRLGILGAERVYYWKLLLWTLFRRPRLFPTAITLAIYGYHFRKTCEMRVS